MNFEQIERHLEKQLKELDEASANPDRIVSFSQYIPVYNTYIELKRAQAAERQAQALENLCDMFHAFDEYGLPVKERR